MATKAKSRPRVPSANRQKEFCRNVSVYRESLLKGSELLDAERKTVKGRNAKAVAELDAQWAAGDLLSGELFRVEKEVDEFFRAEIKAIDPVKLRAIGRYWLASLDQDARNELC